MMIRGVDTTNPIGILLHSGPGFPEGCLIWTIGTGGDRCKTPVVALSQRVSLHAGEDRITYLGICLG